VILGRVLYGSGIPAKDVPEVPFGYAGLCRHALGNQVPHYSQRNRERGLRGLRGGLGDHSEAVAELVNEHPPSALEEIGGAESVESLHEFAEGK
jgi:hypothetical protein